VAYVARTTPGQTNGRIRTAKDVVSGEEITYTDDELNRLTVAEASQSKQGPSTTAPAI
jgi:hypothetical protein